jgi:hypothetical protein
MMQLLSSLLVVLCTGPAFGSQDKPPTPEAQYQALVKEQAQETRAIQTAMRAAKTPEEQEKLSKELYAKLKKLATQFVDLAEKNPKTPVAFDSVVWILSNITAGAKNEPRAKAAAILLRDHVQNEKLSQLCQSLANSFYPEGFDLLRGIALKSSNQEVQAEAMLALGQRLSGFSQLAGLLKERPELAKRIEESFGKEQLEDFKSRDIAKLDAESAQCFKQFGEKYAAQLKPDRLTQLCQRLGYDRGVGGEALLRTLLEKDQRREVQGTACLALARTLKNRSDAKPEAEATEAANLRKQSEKFFDLATLKYADVKMPFRGTVGDQAKRELFELQHLGIGMEAPDIEGEDAEGTHFKLSDYRGKVVLLDFWGNW